MDIKLFFQTIIKFVLGFLITGVFIFIPANTLNYWNGWLLIVLLFVPMFIIGIVLMIKAPDLLRKRLKMKEKSKEQEHVIVLSVMIFVASFVLSGLNYKYSWIIMPKCISIISSSIFLIAYILYAEVLRENKYLSRTVEVQENQKVIDTGLYGIVRHPMYMATIFMFLSMPLILGSIISFLICLTYPVVIAKRIKNEEEMLEKELAGYIEYKEKVKYKLIPFIW